MPSNDASTSLVIGHDGSSGADCALAVGLDRRWVVLAAALRAGDINVAQAEVIARALEDLPREVPEDVLVRAEETLVGHAAEFGPRQLARLGRRILDVVAPDIADEAGPARGRSDSPGLTCTLFPMDQRTKHAIGGQWARPG
jgi:hypothetical protein